MTNRLILGVDVGQTGAIAVFADGEPAHVIDMPTRARKAGGFEIDAGALAAALRGVRQMHSGASTLAVVERVSARPGQGVSTMFRFGQSDGKVRGVLETLGIPIVNVEATKWKRHHGLLGTDKDAARLHALFLWDERVAEYLKRKKDCGRADALLIGAWAVATDQVARAA